MLKVVERTEKMLDRDWLEDRQSLSFLDDIEISVMRDERRLYYRVFEVFSRDHVAPDATVLCLDHGYMLEIINMTRSLDARLHTLAESLLRAANRNYVIHYTREEGEEYSRMGFHCSTVNYSIHNPKPVTPDVSFCPSLEEAFDSREEFMSWVAMVYGKSSIYDIMLTGGRLVSMRDSQGFCGTVISTSTDNNRWIVGKPFDDQGKTLRLSTARFQCFVDCILSSLPKGDQVVYTYHQFEGGCEAMHLLQHGWLPESYLYGRKLKPTNGVNNAD
ncbi:hypothetical protein MLDJOKPK_00050 [Salmonella phage SPAsTU]|nr:hypothetical protein STsAS_088 [Salmonella phage STsAS]AWN09002.1 hypothetical protein MLDJOKPK_00050 [Salmonella phage SPAsTU]